MLKVIVRNEHDREHPGVFKSVCDDLECYGDGDKFADGAVFYCKDWRELYYTLMRVFELDNRGCFSEWRRVDAWLEEREDHVLLAIFEKEPD